MSTPSDRWTPVEAPLPNVWLVDPSGSLEHSLTAADDAAAACLRASAAVTRELRRARTTAKSGDLRALRRAAADAQDQHATLRDHLATLVEASEIDEAAHLGNGTFLREVIREAERTGVTVSADPDSADRLMSYPSVIRVLTGAAAVEVDGKRDRRIRPSVLVARLGKAQQRPSGFRTDTFLATLSEAYDHVIARGSRDAGAVVPLEEVWSVLTLSPSARAAYGKSEFARDLYLLDQSGRFETKEHRTIRFAASTGTRGGKTLTTVTKSGGQQVYWGVAFDASAVEATP